MAMLFVLSAAPAFAQTATVTAAWDRNTDASTAGYIVYYGTGPGNYQWSYDAGNQISAQLTLSTGSVYFVSVRAYNTAAQPGPPSNEATINLANAAPPPTAQITASMQNATTALVTWQTSNAVGAMINGAPVALSGSTSGTISATTTFTIVATSAAGATATNSATATVVPTTPPSGASPDGTVVPSATRIVDAAGAVWTMSGGAILRNGTSAGGGSGVKMLWSGGTIYVLGSTGGSWWKWLGNGWTNVGLTAPGGTVTPPPPPPSGTPSADGATIPGAAQIVDAQGAVWTMNGGAVLRNGASAAGGSGVKALWSGGSIYVLGSTGGNWWKWLGAGWSNVGSAQPGGTVIVPPPPPPPPPPSGSPSVDGTMVPAAAQIVDAQGAVWTLSGGAVLRNGVSAASGTGFRVLWLRGTIYVLGSDNVKWWKWTGATWEFVGTAQPV